MIAERAKPFPKIFDDQQDEAEAQDIPRSRSISKKAGHKLQIKIP